MGNTHYIFAANAVLISPNLAPTSPKSVHFSALVCVMRKKKKAPKPCVIKVSKAFNTMVCKAN